MCSIAFSFASQKTDVHLDYMQSFLTKSEAAFKQHPVWASAPPAHKAQAVEVTFLLTETPMFGVASHCTPEKAFVPVHHGQGN